MLPPPIAIIMGSDSDLSVMKEAAVMLDEFKVTYTLTIVSAHRTPERMMSFTQGAAGQGIKVIIAGAGGAAHLPGMVAACTHLPVIGVPIQSKSMRGIDSLYSIVQMPQGVPVATVAINGAHNAALLALQILALSQDSIREKLIAYKMKLKKTVDSKASELEQSGYKLYLKKKKDDGKIS
ncbi:MAG: 5-(carboxyamino)imidazole ribonucleotide mutase [Chitinophagales bacterium]|jgi:5-(carboxyamino)imidazole ribonucleotide mutase|nr:5-(carboxyamino)imidazole ribonucleotide mutase [Chitinophagales bacterium]